MRSLFNTSLDQLLIDWWNRRDQSSRNAFFFIVGISVLGFGFEMTNLTIHHDDVTQIFIQDDILGHYLGRFGVGKLHYYGQNAYFMPFLQMFIGVVLMACYGLIVARFWGLRGTMHMVLVASIICLFPYMAQVYQYNTSMATYTLAHLFSAAAVVLSVRATFLTALCASLLYVAAFSVYQGVIANAATIFVIWALIKFLFTQEGEGALSKGMLRSTIAAATAGVVGGVIYLMLVSFMELEFDTYQSAGQAFSFKDGLNLPYAATEIVKGTRSFFFWPENYFPNYLKKLQLVLLFCAGIVCLWVPKGVGGKFGALFLLAVAVFAPRSLQLLHPEGIYHNLTLTAYALVVAAAVAIMFRTGHVAVKNVVAVLSFVVIAGYVFQCNWISTVNYLNTWAHYSTLTQILARLRSIPEADWDGESVVVVGRLDMYSEYPFKSATGVATEYMDAEHMQHLSRLMREDVSIVEANSQTPEVLAYAAQRSAWPHSTSVGVLKGVGVVILSPTPHVRE